MTNILASLGFELEMIGGGSYILSKYNTDQSYVWVSCEDGMGLPDYGNWLVVSYPADFDGDYSACPFEAYSADFPAATVFDAVAQAFASIA